MNPTSYRYIPIKMAAIKKASLELPEVLEKMRSNRNSHTLLTRIQNGTDNLENILAVSYKFKHKYNLILWSLTKRYENLMLA